jgi:hypothetical protein
MKTNAGHFIKPMVLSLATGMVALANTGCTSDRDSSAPVQSASSFQPTWRGDNHTQPVYTSPSTSPANPILPDANQLHE